MTKDEANRLLDRHKETKEFSYLDTTRMLSITGDIEEHRSERVDTPIPHESEGNRQTASTGLVAGCEGGHKETPWAGWSRYLDCIDGETT